MSALLLLLLLPFSSPKAQPADFPLEAQVQSAELLSVCGSNGNQVTCGYVQHLAIVIDGKLYKVNGTAYSADILQPGAYPAKVQSTDTHGTTYLHTRIYRLLFPDGKTADYFVVAESQ